MNPARPGPDEHVEHGAARRQATPSRVVVARARGRRGLDEAELVLRATGFSSRRLRQHGEWRLVVSAADALRANEELRRYAAEQLASPVRPSPPPLALVGAGATPWLAGGALLLSWLTQHHRDHGAAWTLAARLDVDAVRAGELWRLFTSLLLHADARHLIGNVGLGAVFLGLLARLLGGSAAVAACVVAACLAHALEVALVTPPRASLGASTAVFACLGLLVGQGLRWRMHLRAGWLRSLGGAACGLALLSWLGAGGERTDVLAHLLGFVFGTTLGLCRGPRAAPGRRAQRWLGFALLVLALSAVGCALLELRAA